MFFVFFLLWVVFNGRLTWEIAVFGVVLSALLYAFCCAFMDYSPKKDLAAMHRIPKMFAYLGLLLVEIIKSNVALTRIVYSRHPNQVKPQLVTFHTPLKGPIVKSVLADSITLTPGTITVLMQNNELTVHCLDKSFSEGIETLEFQNRLQKLEQGGVQHDA